MDLSRNSEPGDRRENSTPIREFIDSNELNRIREEWIVDEIERAMNGAPPESLKT